MNFDNLKIAFQYALPKHGVSKLVGFLARAKLGFVTTGLIKGFIKAYDINMAEAKHSDPKHFKTFNDFFTRELDEGVRPLLLHERRYHVPVLASQQMRLVLQEAVRDVARGDDVVEVGGIEAD